MTRDELLARLRALASARDAETAHGDADDALIEFIGDPDVTAAFAAIPKWYA